MIKFRYHETFSQVILDLFPLITNHLPAAPHSSSAELTYRNIKRPLSWFSEIVSMNAYVDGSLIHQHSSDWWSLMFLQQGVFEFSGYFKTAWGSVAKTSFHICFPPTTHSAEMVHSHTLSDTTKHLRELGGEENKTAAKGQMYKSASKIRKRCLMFQRRHVTGTWVGSVAVQEGWGWGKLEFKTWREKQKGDWWAWLCVPGGCLVFYLFH